MSRAAAVAAERAPSRPTSDAHPDVVEYRRKLRSVETFASTQLGALDRQLEEYLQSVKTPVPPPPDMTAEDLPTRPDHPVLALPSRPPRP